MMYLLFGIVIMIMAYGLIKDDVEVEEESDELIIKIDNAIGRDINIVLD